MDQMAELPRRIYKRRPYFRTDAPHPLRDWFKVQPRSMTHKRFAELVGCSASYVTQLCADNGPWPGRDVLRRIGEVTNGAVTPDTLAGYVPKKK